MGSLSRRGFLRASVATGLGASGVGSLAGCLAPIASGVSGTDWPQFRYDPARTGYNPGTAGPSDEVTEQWSFQTDDRSVSTPAVVGGTVFVNSDSFAAIDARDGASKWAKGVFHRSGTAPAVAEDAVFVASKFALWSLSAEDGTERWNVTYGNRQFDAPAVENGTLYIVSTASQVPFEASLHALSTDDGTERWRTPVGELTLPPFVPAVADGTVYVGKEKLFAIDAEDGSHLWTADPGGTFGTPAVVDGTVYVGSRQGDNLGAVFAFDAEDGTEQWRFDTGKSAKSLAVADSEVYVASDSVFSLLTEDGSERWRLDSNRYVLASPSVTQERVYLGGLLGTVRALDRDDGSEAWSVETQGVVFSSPSAVEDAVYVGGSDQRV